MSLDGRTEMPPAQPAVPEPVGGVEERIVPGLGGAIPVRMYWSAERFEGMPMLQLAQRARQSLGADIAGALAG